MLPELPDGLAPTSAEPFCNNQGAAPEKGQDHNSIKITIR